MEDMSDRYNTALSPDEEKEFQAWAKAQNKLGDLFDYDLRGFWRDTKGKLDERGHGPDTYKKPNHPTFSNESKYHMVDGYEGGEWAPMGDGKNFAFRPGRSNFWPTRELEDYFSRAEPNAMLAITEDRP